MQRELSQKLGRNDEASVGHVAVHRVKHNTGDRVAENEARDVT